MTNDVRSKKGTVKAVRLPEPERGEGEPVMSGNIPALESPVVVELHGHEPHRYVVRVAPGPSGPVLVELRILSDADAPIDPAVMKSVPVPRLAYAAMQWLTRAGGLLGLPGDTSETYAKPETEETTRRRRKADAALLEEVAGHVAHAVAHGLPIQKYVGQRMGGASTATADRWIRKAKEEGFIEDRPLPRRKKGGNNPMT
ncbi:hypothetical protein [Nocardia farcinica]|uniref:hypothetical protein n=1 Tax=Nocardia farcinica TaxID=37329 RepID=UPI0018942479|nr:hypothetical protein [Nocardia farcinica]MBF6070134.1 hypothetical protein [Nocardia farcinica]